MKKKKKNKKKSQKSTREIFQDMLMELFYGHKRFPGGKTTTYVSDADIYNIYPDPTHNPFDYM